MAEYRLDASPDTVHWGYFDAGLAPLLTGETVDDALEGALEAVRRHIPSGKLSDDLAVMLLENLAVRLPEPVYRGFPEQTRYEGSAPR